jgi:K+-transporting ATPase ATPase B chain
VDVLLLDKTGTITIGNRKATNFYSVDGITENEFIRLSVLGSLSDDTPEGKSIVELALQKGINAKAEAGSQFIKFTAETRSSGVDTPSGFKIRKGAFDAIRDIVTKNGNTVPAATSAKVKSIAANGGTPLVVAVNNEVKGVIELQDIIKPGIQERFQRLRKMGVKTVMVTGDNPLTANYIANVAGVDDFIAEAKPEDKMHYIRQEQASGKLVAMMGLHWRKLMLA